jgi:hypothetical protein
MGVHRFCFRLVLALYKQLDIQAAGEGMEQQALRGHLTQMVSARPTLLRLQLTAGKLFLPMYRGIFGQRLETLARLVELKLVAVVAVT